MMALAGAVAATALVGCADKWSGSRENVASRGEPLRTGTYETLADLRAAHVPLTDDDCYVVGHGSATDGGGGHFFFDINSLAADDDGTVVKPDTLNATDPGRWLRVFDEATGYNVRWFGAVGDGQTNDTGSVQATIDAVSATGGTVFFPAGTYLCSQGLTIRANHITLRGAAPEAATVKTSTTNVDLITIGDTSTVSFLRLENLSLTCGGQSGHVFYQARGISMSTFRGLFVGQNNPAKSIWDGGDGNLYIDVLWTESSLQHVNGATVPGFRLAAAGGVNSNTWFRLRATYSGDYFFSLDCTSNQTYSYDNVFREITGEVLNGGFIRLQGCFNCLIDHCVSYDLTGITNDVFSIGAGSGGILTRHVTVRDTWIASGSLGSRNLVGLDAGGCQLITLEGLDTSGLNSCNVDLGNNPGVVLLANRGNITWTNEAGGTVRVQAGFGGSKAGVYMHDVGMYRDAASIVRSDGIVRGSGLTTLVTAGRPSDTDFPTTPPDGTIAADSSNNKLWVRIGGVWKGVALT